MNYYLLLVIIITSVSCNLSEEKKKTSPNLALESPNLQTDAQKSIQRGSEIYADFCVRCHMPEGEGVATSFPPLAGSDYLMTKRTESIKAVKYGQSGEIKVNGKTYNGIMAPMGLTDQEVADVMNYIMNSWGNKQEKMITLEEVLTVEK